MARPSELATVVEETSGGRFRIEVFPGGQIMQPFECFEAASKGTIELFMGAPYYWTDKEPGIEWFATIPFGMNCDGMAAWYYQGDGRKLWWRRTASSISCRAQVWRLLHRSPPGSGRR